MGSPFVKAGRMTQAAPRTSYQLTFAVLATGTSAYALLQSLVVPVLPTLQHDLHTTQDTVTWVLTAYLLSASIFTPIMGRVGDMIGKERVFVAALIALSAGSLLAAVASNIGIMIVARVIQGVGGGIIPLAFGIIRDEFPDEKVATAVGVIASIIAVGGGLGIVLAGPIVDALDYHWLFWIPMIMTIAAAVAAHFFVPESPVRSSGRISWLPAVALSAWLVALLVALSEAPLWGWGSPKVVGLLIAAAVLIAAWIRTEQRAKTPLIDMQMMKQPAVWTNNLVSLLMGMAMYGSFAFLPEFVQTPTDTGYGFGASIVASGLILLPSSVTMFLVGLYSARIARRIGGKVTVILGCLIAGASMAIIAFAHSEKWELYLSTAIMGVGFGLAYAAMSSLIVAAVPPHQTGVASGMNANIRTIGGSIGAALMASVVTSQLAADGLPKEIGYTVGFAALAVALVAGAVAAAFIPRVTDHREIDRNDEPPHAELAIVAGGTVVGDKPE
jgi:EmrB/QacA subfamily drug resistance transporter